MRPGWGTASSIYNWIFGILNIIAGIGMIGLAVFVADANIVTRLLLSDSGIIIYLIAALYILLGLLRCICGWGLWEVQNWARITAVALHGLSGLIWLTYGALLFLNDNPFSAIAPLLFFIPEAVLAVGLLLQRTGIVYQQGGEHTSSTTALGQSLGGYGPGGYGPGGYVPPAQAAGGPASPPYQTPSPPYQAPSPPYQTPLPTEETPSMQLPTAAAGDPGALDTTASPPPAPPTAEQEPPAPADVPPAPPTAKQEPPAPAGVPPAPPTAKQEPPAPAGVPPAPPTAKQEPPAPAGVPPAPSATGGVARTELAEPPPSETVLAWLIERTGPRAGREHRLREQVTIGRDPARCEVVLDDSKVSGAHARIRMEGDQFVFSDLNSTNHSFVNGEQVQQHTLRDGDHIHLGPNVHLTFLLVTTSP
jgi:hypothetical protein